jgi:shikimate kinase
MNNIHIIVKGVTGSGKSAIQHWLADQLATKFANVDIEWGVDGDSRRTATEVDTILENISRTTKITVLDEQAKRGF